MRSKFDEQLARLNNDMIEMGALCEEAIALAAQAITEGDESLRREVVRISSEIDHKERDIEARCLKLLLQQQPVARDLRQISAALKMITDMERIGDQAEDIAEITTYLEGYHGDETVLIHAMAKEAINMVTDSVDAFVRSDMNLANDVLSHDDIVDNYFAEVKKSLIDMIAQNNETGEYALDFLMIAKYFERIGDHATNIAEWVIFSITGIHKEANE